MNILGLISQLIGIKTLRLTLWSPVFSVLHFRLPLKKTHIHNPFLGDFIKPNQYRSRLVCGLPFLVWAGCFDLGLGLVWWSRLGLA